MPTQGTPATRGSDTVVHELRLIDTDDRRHVLLHAAQIAALTTLIRAHKENDT